MTKPTRKQIVELSRAWYDAEHEPQAFRPGVDVVPVSGKVIDANDIAHLVEASLDGWLTTGRFAREFEKSFAKKIGTRSALLCNSGSSANLLAMTTLTSPKLRKRRMVEGDEVITAVAGFPTTVNPILQNRFLPVFVDVEMETYDATADAVEAAITPKTKAIFMAHTLGNPFDVVRMRELADAHGLWLIEDTCDAIGGSIHGQAVGTVGCELCEWGLFEDAVSVEIVEDGGLENKEAGVDIAIALRLLTKLAYAAIVANVHHAKARQGTYGRDGCDLAVRLVKAQEFVDRYIGETITVGQHKALAFDVVANTVQATTCHRVGVCTSPIGSGQRV